MPQFNFGIRETVRSGRRRSSSEFLPGFLARIIQYQLFHANRRWIRQLVAKLGRSMLYRSAMLNSDRYGRGNRLFLTVKVPINRAFSVVMFATQATTHASTNAPQQRIDIGLFYNLLYHLQKTGLF